jgi:uncharacterized protein (DUF433 family)/DNA-binding transcriptional MerR regulator
MAFSFDYTEQAVYTPRRLGALAGVSGNTIGQWARNDLIRPTISRGLPSNLYSFFDAAEAIAVRWLRDNGRTYKQIHNAIEGARRDDKRAGKKHAAWPLSSSKLGLGRATAETKHDRGSIVLKDQSDGQYLDVTHGYDQIAFKPEFWLAIEDVLRSGGWIARDLRLKQIEVEPGLLGGRPTLAGTRWSVDHVALIAADEEGRCILHEQYELPDKGVRECVQWADAASRLGRPRQPVVAA